MTKKNKRNIFCADGDWPAARDASHFLDTNKILCPVRNLAAEWQFEAVTFAIVNFFNLIIIRRCIERVSETSGLQHLSIK